MQSMCAGHDGKETMGLTEQKHCELFYAWAEHNPNLGEYLIKNVNEGKRSWFTARLLKLIGFRAGIPDYQYPVPNERYIGLWIEMKRTELKGKKNSNNFQELWLEKLKKVGHYATYAYGYADAIAITKAYLENRL